MTDAKETFKNLCDSLLMSDNGINGESYNLLLDLAEKLGLSSEEIKKHITSADAVDDNFYRSLVLKLT